MGTRKLILIGIAILIGLVLLDFGTGYLGVLKTKTVGKAQQNAEREVFEESQSYVEGKRQAAIKYYKEYRLATNEQKQSLEFIIAQDFANFDEDKYLSGELKAFIKKCKY